MQRAPTVDLLSCLRMIVEALVMTASDLCSSSKPWDLQLATVTVIYEEFYSQVQAICTFELLRIDPLAPALSVDHHF